MVGVVLRGLLVLHDLHDGSPGTLPADRRGGCGSPVVLDPAAGDHDPAAGRPADRPDVHRARAPGPARSPHRPAEPPAAHRPDRGRAGPGSAHRGPAGRHLPGPRPVQGGQRRPRPRGRRHAAGRRQPSADRRRALRRHPGPVQRRRVRRGLRGHPRCRDPVPGRADPGRAAAPLLVRQPRGDDHRQHRRGHRDPGLHGAEPAARGRLGDVPGQERRARPGGPLPPDHARPGHRPARRPPRTAPGPRARRAARALPADRGPGHRRGRPAWRPSCAGSTRSAG